MIASIKVRNFQSLRSVDVELGRFTVILGESDLGKSALFRAVVALCTNQAGQEFIAYGARQAGVSLALDSGSVAWVKDGSSRYVLQVGEHRSEFSKTGRTVPAEVAELLHLGELEAGDSVLRPNFHQQFDPPFLVANTGSVRAKILGELSGINRLYVATSEARRREGALRKLVIVRESDADAAKVELERFSYLEQAVELARDAAAAFEEATLLAERCEAIKELRKAYTSNYLTLEYVRARKELLARRAVALAALAVPSAVGVERLAALVALDCACAGRLAAVRERRRALENRLAQLAELLNGVTECPTCGQMI